MRAGSEELLHRYLNGDLEGRELEEFRRALSRDPDLRRRLADLAVDDVLLSDVIREESARTGVPAEAPRGRRPWIRLAAAAVAAAAALLAVLLRQGTPPPAVDAPVARLEAAEGAVEFRAVGSARWSLLRIGDRLAAGDAVRTGEVRARLAAASGSEVTLNRQTEVVLRSRPEAPGLRLEKGEVFVRTDPRDAGLWVETAHGQAVSLGTRFGVMTDAARTTVVVVSGRVAFANDAGGVFVTAGASAQASASSMPSSPEPVDAEALTAWHRPLSPAAPALAEADGPLSIPAFSPAGPAWSRGLSLYEVDVRLAPPDGTLASLAGRLPELKELGVGILCLLPFYPTGSYHPDPRFLSEQGGCPLPVPESLRIAAKGGPFSPSDHRALDPRLGTLDHLRRFIDESHRLGLRVLLDFVPNQTSWDHVLTGERPDFYQRGPGGTAVWNRPWMEVARLDYGNRALWDYMADARRMWVDAFGLDGFRETTADRIPADHWAWLRPRLDALTPVFLFADAEDPRHHPAFDATYDWALQACLAMIARGRWPASSLDRLLAEEARRYPPGAVRVRLLTNHDMIRVQFGPRSLAHIPEGERPHVRGMPLEENYGGPGGHRAAALLCATLPGSKPMIWNGQEYGFLARPPGPIPWGDTQNPWWRFYRTLLGAHRDNPALHEGDFARIRTEPDDAVYAFTRSRGSNRTVVLVNLSPRPQAVRLRSAAMAGTYTDVFSESNRTLGTEETLSLDPWEFHLWARGTR